MTKLRTAEDLARQLAEESSELELYYQELSRRQPLRRVSDHLSLSSDKETSGIPAAAGIDDNEQLASSYAQFLEETAEISQQNTGMANGVWIDASEFSARNGKWQTPAATRQTAKRS